MSKRQASASDRRHGNEGILSRLPVRPLTRDMLIDAEDFRGRGRSDYLKGRRPR